MRGRRLGGGEGGGVRRGGGGVQGYGNKFRGAYQDVNFLNNYVPPGCKRAKSANLSFEFQSNGVESVCIDPLKKLLFYSFSTNSTV